MAGDASVVLASPNHHLAWPDVIIMDVTVFVSGIISASQPEPRIVEQLSRERCIWRNSVPRLRMQARRTRESIVGAVHIRAWMAFAKIVWSAEDVRSLLRGCRTNDNLG
jgi:hypothetical protein